MSADPPIPIDPDFRIQLPNFEGPLDLLLYLIQKHELDVIDLPVAFVTEKYVEYLGLMQRLNLDVAAEYLLMAATLAHIKSRSLLPPDPQADAAEQAQEEEQDPRAELIRRLLEYQKYKKVAEDLGARGVAGRDVFPRGSAALDSMGPAPLAEFSVFKLLDAFKKVAATVKGGLSLEVTAERITIQDRINEITTLLEARRSIRFEQLFEGATTTYELVVSFLALLEMAKMRMIRIYQSDPDSPIHLEYRLLHEHDEEAPSREGAEDAPDIDDGPQRTVEDAPDIDDGPESTDDDIAGYPDPLENDAPEVSAAIPEGPKRTSDDIAGYADDAPSTDDDIAGYAHDAPSTSDDIAGYPDEPPSEGGDIAGYPDEPPSFDPDPDPDDFHASALYADDLPLGLSSFEPLESLEPPPAEPGDEGLDLRPESGQDPDLDSDREHEPRS